MDDPSGKLAKELYYRRDLINHNHDFGFAWLRMILFDEHSTLSLYTVLFAQDESACEADVVAGVRSGLQKQSIRCTLCGKAQPPPSW